MKINKLSFVVGLVFVTLGLGCVNNGNTNLIRKNMTLPYKPGEMAVTTTTTSNVVNGVLVGNGTSQVAETGLAVNARIAIQQINAGRDIGVTEKIGNNGDGGRKGLLALLFGPTTNNYSGGGGVTSSGGGVGGCVTSGGGGFTR